MTRVLWNAGWLVMTVLAVIFALSTVRYFFLDPSVAAPPPLLDMVMRRNTLFMVHAAGGLIALAAGAWNFLERSREKFLNLHRWLGRIYLVSVLVSGLAGFSLAFTAQGALAGRVGFGMLAVLWLTTGAFAYVRIRGYDIESHRRWMIRNYSLTFGAVTLRIWLVLFMGVGYDFPEAYAAVAWLSWVPNLVIAETIASRSSGPSTRNLRVEAN